MAGKKVSPDPQRLSSIDKRLPKEKLFVKRLRNGLSGRTTELISTPRSLIIKRRMCASPASMISPEFILLSVVKVPTSEATDLSQAKTASRENSPRVVYPIR